jgi:two-component system nitrogen regulation sensor histidine kinase GlnL
MLHPDARAFLIDNLTTAVLLFDDTLKLVDMNPAAEGLLDLSAKKSQGIEVFSLFPEASAYTGALARAAKSGQACTEREMQLHLSGARVVTVECTVIPLYEPFRLTSSAIPSDRNKGPGKPAVAGIMVELVQLDRHKRITREEQLLSQNEMARALARGLAHEIRNPLSGLRGAAQLLERELDNEELKEYTHIIIREADRLQNLLDRMLGPRTPPQKRWLSIHEITERVYVLVQAEAPPHLSLERDYDPSIPDIHADPEMLIQSLLNVVRNAVQALQQPSGSRKGRIVLRTRIHRNFTIGHRYHRLVVRIAVSDNGPGIPAGLLESIFYPLVTGRPEGTGLGLPIAQSLVNQHGGLIECSSGPEGTTFSILLPVESGS